MIAKADDKNEENNAKLVQNFGFVKIFARNDW